MKKIKRISALVLAVVMCFTLLCVGVMAEGVNVAKIGDTEYASLAEAFSAAQNGDTVTMIADEVLTASYTEIHSSVTLDLNGKTISGGALDVYATVTVKDSAGGGSITGVKHGIWVNPGYTLSVESGTVSTTNENDDGCAIVVDDANLNITGGDVTNSKNDSIAILVMGTSNATISGGSVTAAGDNGNAILVQDSAVANISGGTVNGHDWGVTVFGNSVLNVSGSAVIKTSDIEGYAIAFNGNAGQNATVNISGGTVTGTELGVYQPSGTLNVTGGTISGATGIYFKSNTLNISGGTINGTGAKADYNFNGNGGNPTGDALVIDSCGYPNGIGTVSVSGGTFTSSNAEAVASYNTEGNDAVTGFISGGSFNTAPSAASLAEGYQVSGNGPYIVKQPVAKIGDTEYVSLKDAVAAAQNGETIIMIADESVDVNGYAITIASGKNVTLDLNGKTVVGMCSTSGTSALIRNLGTLTICDSASGGKLIGGADPTWTWDGTDNYAGSYASNLIRNEGTLIVNGGTLYNASTGSAAYAIDNYGAGKVTINGGTVDAKKASAIRLFYNNVGTIEVTGGTIGHYADDDDCSYMGIQGMAGVADITVSGGTIAGMYALYTSSTGNNINISGGTFDGYVGIGAAYAGNLSITGGTFLEWVGTWGTHTGFMTGGTYSELPDDEYIANGYWARDNGDGTWTVVPFDYDDVFTFEMRPTGNTEKLDVNIVDAEAGGTVSVDIVLKNAYTENFVISAFQIKPEFDTDMTFGSSAKSADLRGTYRVDTNSAGAIVIDYFSASDLGLFTVPAGDEIIVGTMTLQVKAASELTHIYGDKLNISLNEDATIQVRGYYSEGEDIVPSVLGGQVELATTYTMTWNAGEGSFEDGNNPHTTEVGVNLDPADEDDYEEPTRPGFTFDGWDPEVPDKATQDVTFTAKWKLNGAVVFADYQYAANGDKLMLIGLDDAPASGEALFWDNNALFMTENENYTKLLNELAGRTGEEGSTKFTKVYVYIVNGALTVNEVYPALAIKAGANKSVDRDGDVNNSGKVNAGDFGIVDDLLANRENGAGVEARLEADVNTDDYDYDSYRFGSIEDIVRIIEISNGNYNP